MSINANKSKNGKLPSIPPVEAGTYPARLVLIADLGLQPQREFKGEKKEPAYELLTTYELLDEFMKDEDGNELKDKPRWITETFPLYSLHSERAKSTKRYISLDPDMRYAGDWAKLIGMPCMVTVIINKGQGKNAGKEYNNIANIAPMRSKEAAGAAKLVNEPVVFDLDEASVDAFKKLPEWVQKKIAGGLEFKGSVLDDKLGGAHAEPTEEDDGADDLDDEVPF